MSKSELVEEVGTKVRELNAALEKLALSSEANFRGEVSVSHGSIGDGPMTPKVSLRLHSCLVSE